MYNLIFMRKFPFLALLLIGVNSFAQTIENDSTRKVIAVPKTEESYIAVEQMPEFPGGNEAMNQFIVDNIKYPSVGVKKKIQGKVYLKFKVNADGNISDTEVVRGIKDYPAFEEEAIRVIKLMPAWIPGKQDGKYVSVWFTLPFNFSL